MRIKYNVRDYAVTPTLKAFINEKIGFSLSRFAQRIRVVIFSISQTRSNNGELQCICVIKVKLNQYKTLVAEEQGRDMYLTVQACSYKAKRKIERHFYTSRTKTHRANMMQYSRLKSE
ncbi:HPF/RaiA family ribosome-associated protein [Alteromonas facilis]|uniref:HPF/RaiA family ribosome-associated protein n=1 Tax=Alteromonas facilis TaxID=2048004 RepID=UPI000C28BE95|nr:HPF/RaiA family ribosome-associated protein [Alteromonas facilis]